MYFNKSINKDMKKPIKTHSAPADEVVGVGVLHQGPQLGEEGGDIAGVDPIHASRTRRLLHNLHCFRPTSNPRWGKKNHEALGSLETRGPLEIA